MEAGIVMIDMREHISLHTYAYTGHLIPRTTAVQKRVGREKSCPNTGYVNLFASSCM